MSTTTNRSAAPSLNRNADNLHLVCGSGGSRAILASSGAILGLHRAGFTKWCSIGGISGGSIPSLFLANGFTPEEIVKLAIEIDFSSLLTRRKNIVLTFLAFLLKDRLAQTRPRKAVLTSEKLGTFLEERVLSWPESYWTMAVAGRTQVFFTAKGVFQYLKDGSCRQLSDKPAPLGIAVRASCAVPGIIEASQYKGLYLFDGALSWAGQTPIGAVVQHYRVRPATIFACDVGDRKGGMSDYGHRFWRVLCGDNCVWPQDEEDPAMWQEQGSTVLTPAVNQFASLQFTLTAEQKWDAVRSGYTAAICELWKGRLIDNQGLLEMSAPAANLEVFTDTFQR